MSWDNACLIRLIGRPGESSLLKQCRVSLQFSGFSFYLSLKEPSASLMPGFDIEMDFVWLLKGTKANPEFGVAHLKDLWAKIGKNGIVWDCIFSRNSMLGERDLMRPLVDPRPTAGSATLETWYTLLIRSRHTLIQAYCGYYAARLAISLRILLDSEGYMR